MKKIEIPFLDTNLYTHTLKNGLTVSILPRPSFHQTFGIFATNYGSIDRTFIPLGEKEWFTAPDGVAHFLEHKMFEKKEGDVFQKFGTQGASANAYTSFTRTAYLFSCTDCVSENVETLLDFVQVPYFTEATVAKERGIIGEEIQMYNDDPDWQLYFGTIGSMFPTHPVRLDIAGTQSSIAKITKDMLYTCYHTFYHPSNMVLFLVGNIDSEQMMTFIEENQSKKTFEPKPSIKRKIFIENGAVCDKHMQMAIQMPKMKVGIRSNIEENKSGKTWIKDEWTKNLLLYYLFGPQSKNYMRLMDKGFITNQFSVDYMEERSFGFGMIGGQTKEPEALKHEIHQILHEAQSGQLDESAFQLLMKKQRGQFFMAFHSLDWIANQFIRFALQGASFFDVPKILDTISLEDFERIAKNWFHPQNLSSFTIFPKK